VRAEKFDDSTICFTVNGLGCDLELVSLMPIEVNICELETYNFSSGDNMEI
jgi:hypothetical protein